MLRTLQLTKEVRVFLAVTFVMSVVYLGLTTGEHTRPTIHTNPTPPPAELESGKPINVTITLVTADSRDLACASSTNVGSAHCAYTSEGAPFPEASDEHTKAEDIISPYMTTDNVLFMVPGLWQEPTVAKRLQEEPPTKYERDQLRRFNANCQMKLEQKLTSFKVRWSPTAPWSDRDSAWVGRVSGCSITDT